jgi:hypothetical protein
MKLRIRCVGFRVVPMAITLFAGWLTVHEKTGESFAHL